MFKLINNNIKKKYIRYSMMVRVNPREHEEPWFYKDFLLEKSEK